MASRGCGGAVLVLALVALCVAAATAKTSQMRQNIDCKMDRQGWDYHGTLTKTKSGRTCQSWSRQFPHRHRKNKPYMFPNDRSVKAARNYCRNPDKSSMGPWCYTSLRKPRWEYCAVPECPDPFLATPQLPTPTPKPGIDVDGPSAANHAAKGTLPEPPVRGVCALNGYSCRDLGLAYCDPTTQCYSKCGKRQCCCRQEEQWEAVDPVTGLVQRGEPIETTCFDCQCGNCYDTRKSYCAFGYCPAGTAACCQNTPPRDRTHCHRNNDKTVCAAASNFCTNLRLQYANPKFCTGCDNHAQCCCVS